MEQQLNETKNLLQRPDFENIRNNSAYEVSIRNLQKSLSKKINPQHSTKGWIKMIDLLSKENVWKVVSAKPVRALFNAELPGGFIFAANHLFQTHNIDFDWVAASYSPQYSSSALEDIYGLFAANPTRILTGPIQTNKGEFWNDGDLTQSKMPSIIAQLAVNRLGGKMTLITADGGLDVKGRENEQEVLSIPLILGEVKTALLCLDLGGVFILKLFTFFTPLMETLIIWLGRHFQEFELYKPHASSPANSEIYFIGIGFKGATAYPIGNASTELIQMTPEEKAWIEKFRANLVEKQIESINNLLKKQTTPISTEVYDKLLFLPKNKWLTTE